MNDLIIFKRVLTKVFLLLLGFHVLWNYTSAQERKNVLFLMADDFNYWTEMDGYYPRSQTPNINDLASKGIFFREAHCSSPVCNPSRNALWSGFRPSTNGIDANTDGFVRDKPGLENVITMNQYFMENGYYVYGAGKLWHPKMSASNYESDPLNWSYINENGMGCNGGNLYEYGLTTTTNYKWSANPDPMTEENCNDYGLAKDVEELLANYASSPNADKPFFIGCGFFRPHMPWNSPLQFWDQFNIDNMVIPPGYNEELDSPGNNNHQEIVNDGKWMQGIHAYLASLALADYNVGVVLDALENSPYKDNTIVLFMGDHGWHLGEKGHWGKFTTWDEANHTTLVIYDPSSEGNGQECTKVVSLQDLYPTLMELCNLPENPYVEGNSLKPLLDDPDREDWTHPILMTYNGTDYIKTNTWRFIEEGTNSKLYNNTDDPYQWNNLYGKSGYDNVVADLRAKIDSIKQIGYEKRNNFVNEQPPFAPGNLVAYPVSKTQIDLSWSDVAAEDGYIIFRQVNGTGDFSEIDTIEANSTSYSDTDVIDANTYSYYLEVFNDHGEDQSNIVSGIRPADSQYAGIALPYEGAPWSFPGDEVIAWKYDKVNDGDNWAADSGIVIGLHNLSTNGEGQDPRGYGADNPYPAARFNFGAIVFRENGQWTRYTCNFEQTGIYLWKFRGRDLGSTPLSLTVLLRDPNDLKIIKSFSVANQNEDCINEGGGNDNTDWFIAKNSSMQIPKGNYVVEIDMRLSQGQGMLGDFTFILDPASNVNNEKSKIRHYLLNPLCSEKKLLLDLTYSDIIVDLEIFNLSGQKIISERIAGEQKLTYPLPSSIQNGYYFLVINSEGKRKTERFVVR